MSEPTKPQPEKSQEGTPTTSPLRAISPEQLREIVEAHRKWVETNEKEGAQALLWGTNLQGANLINATLQGADLPIVLGLTQEQLDEACGDAETRLPSGLKIDPCRRGVSSRDRRAAGA